MWRRPYIFYWLTLLIVFAYAIWSLPESNSSAENQELVKIAVAALNAREQPNIESPIIAQVNEDETYFVSEVRGEWAQVRLTNGDEGWIAGWHAEYVEGDVANWLSEQTSAAVPRQIQINHDGTYVRSGPQTTHKIIHVAQAGDTFSALSRKGDWLEIELNDGRVGYIAGWVVDARHFTKVKRGNEKSSLKGKTILIDPGHGGNDVGAIGPHLGTLEKVINLQVSRLLGQKLSEAGATVLYTRSDDRKISLEDRVFLSNSQQVDAFISIHHNTSENNPRVNGLITYYYDEGTDRRLAELIQEETVLRTGQTDLGSRYGNYLILRENARLSALCELGFMTHYPEELLVNTRAFQEQAATGIAEGIYRYFEETK